MLDYVITAYLWAINDSFGFVFPKISFITLHSVWCYINLPEDGDEPTI